MCLFKPGKLKFMSAKKLNHFSSSANGVSKRTIGNGRTGWKFLLQWSRSLLPFSVKRVPLQKWNAHECSNTFDCLSIQQTLNFSLQLSSKEWGIIYYCWRQDRYHTFFEEPYRITWKQNAKTIGTMSSIFLRRQVYKQFFQKYSILRSDPRPSCPFFVNKWKEVSSKKEARITYLFSRSPLSVKLETVIQMALDLSKDTTNKNQKGSTFIWLAVKVRLDFKKSSALLHPDLFYFKFVDGADQIEFGLPHFVTKTKNEREIAPNACLIGILDRQERRNLHLFTMIQQN